VVERRLGQGDNANLLLLPLLVLLLLDSHSSCFSPRLRSASFLRVFSSAIALRRCARSDFWSVWITCGASWEAAPRGDFPAQRSAQAAAAAQQAPLMQEESS